MIIICCLSCRRKIGACRGLPNINFAYGKMLLLHTFSPQLFAADARSVGDSHPSGFLNYRQDLPQTALPTLFLLTWRFWGFLPRRGDTLHRSRSNLAGRPLLPAKFHLNRLRGGDLRRQKSNSEKMEFYLYNCP